LKSKIDLLVRVYKDLFSMAKIITKFSSIKIINHFVQYREMIVIYCEILKETHIYRVDKIMLRGNSYLLVICWFVS